MNLIADKILLLLFGMAGMFLSGIHAEFISAFLLALLVSALCCITADRRISWFLISIYIVLAVFCPNLLWFLPLILYDAPVQLAVPVTAALLFIRNGALPLSESAGAVSDMGLFVRTLLVLASIAAQFLQHKTRSARTLHDALLRTRDDDTEIQLLLEERNRTLREKQDAEIYSATLKERNRIAREIHDNVGHMLTRSILLVGALRTISKEPVLAQPLSDLSDTLNQAMNSIRESVHDLHDSSVSLKDTLQSLVDDFTFCQASLEYDMSAELPSQLRYSFIAIVKEALVNTAKHSKATNVTVSAFEHPGFYQLIIRDNGMTTGQSGTGQSFGETVVFSENGGIGLKNMYSRVLALKGTIQITAKDGFRIYITVPKEP